MNSMHGETDGAAVDALVALALAQAEEALRRNGGGSADAAADERDSLPTGQPGPR